jgi:hypothetical protein
VKWYEKYKVDVPEGECGEHRIERFEVSEEDAAFERMRARIGAYGSPWGIGLVAGEYTKLVRGRGTIVMSDTPDEIMSHMDFIYAARGRVLITGLGLGMVARACLLKDEVTEVWIVEKETEVLDLVVPWLGKINPERCLLKLVHADALDWIAPKAVRFTYVWHDIWDDLCGDNVEQMKRLHRKYGRRCDSQASWMRSQMEMQR